MNIQADLYKIASRAREVSLSSFPYDPHALDASVEAAAGVFQTQLTALHHAKLRGRPLYLTRMALPSILEVQLLPDLHFGLPRPLEDWMRIIHAYAWPDCPHRFEPVFRAGRERIPGGTRLTWQQRIWATVPVDWSCLKPAALLSPQAYRAAMRQVNRSDSARPALKE